MAIPPKSYYIPGAGKGKPGKVNKIPKFESDNDGDEMKVPRLPSKPKAKAVPVQMEMKMPKFAKANKAKAFIDKMAVKAMAKKAAPKKAKKKK